MCSCSVSNHVMKSAPMHPIALCLSFDILCKFCTLYKFHKFCGLHKICKRCKRHKHCVDFTKFAKSAKFVKSSQCLKSRHRNASDSGIESLWQTNDRRSVTQVTILDALTHGLAPFPSVTEFQLVFRGRALSHVRTPSEKQKIPSSQLLYSGLGV